MPRRDSHFRPAIAYRCEGWPSQPSRQASHNAETPIRLNWSAMCLAASKNRASQLRLDHIDLPERVAFKAIQGV